MKFDLSSTIPVHETANTKNILAAVDQALQGQSTEPWADNAFGLGTPALWRCQGTWDKTTLAPGEIREATAGSDTQIGKIYDPTKGDGFDVLGQAPMTSPNSRNYRDYIKFHATGYTYSCDRSAHQKGKVKDRFKPVIEGFGYPGDTDTDLHSDYVYKVWHDMLRRCLQHEHASYADYGGAGIRVCDRWRSFTVFEKDVNLMLGAYYQRKGEAFRLDKDHFQSKVYSPETCVWIPRAINTIYAKTQAFKAVSPDGKVTTHLSESALARETEGLAQASISRVLTGQTTQTQSNWKFERLSEVMRCQAPKDPLMDLLTGRSTEAVVGSWLPEESPHAGTTFVVSEDGGVLNATITGAVGVHAPSAYGLLLLVIATSRGLAVGTLEMETNSNYTLKDVVIPAFQHINDLDMQTVRIG